MPSNKLTLIYLLLIHHLHNHNHFTNNIPKDHSNTGKFVIHVYHQNIRGISNKNDEFLASLCYNRPQIICLTEHHLKTQEINNTNLDQYKLGASFCRKKYKYGGVCIYVSKTLQFSVINLEKYHKEKDLEICALKLNVQTNDFIIICIYRSPTSDFTHFLLQIETILN
jgi:exonuclease III